MVSLFLSIYMYIHANLYTNHTIIYLFPHHSFSYVIKLKYKEEGAPYVESTTS